MSEKEIHRQGLSDFQVGSELFAIVSCDTFQRCNPFEQSDHRLGHQIGLFAGDAPQQSKTRFAFGQCDDGSLLIFSKNQVDFPVTEARTLLDNRRAFLDTLAVGDFAPAISLTVTLATFLLTTQVGPQGSASTFVRVKVLVNMLMANCDAFFLEPSRDLFWAPVFTDFLFY